MNLIEDICRKITCPPRFKYSLYDLGTSTSIKDRTSSNTESVTISLSSIKSIKKCTVAFMSLPKLSFRDAA